MQTVIALLIAGFGYDQKRTPSLRKHKMRRVWMAPRRVTCSLGNVSSGEGLSECCWPSLEKKKRLLEDCAWMTEVTCPWSTGHGYQKILKQGASSRSPVSGSACWGRLSLVARLRLCCVEPIADGRAGAPCLGLGNGEADCCCSQVDRLIVVLEKLCRELETNPMDVAAELCLGKKQRNKQTQTETNQVMLSRNRLILKVLRYCLIDNTQPKLHFQN